MVDFMKLITSVIPNNHMGLPKPKGVDVFDYIHDSWLQESGLSSQDTMKHGRIYEIYHQMDNPVFRGVAVDVTTEVKEGHRFCVWLFMNIPPTEEIREGVLGDSWWGVKEIGFNDLSLYVNLTATSYGEYALRHGPGFLERIGLRGGPT